MSRRQPLVGSAWPPVVAIDLPAVTMSGPSTQPRRMASRRESRDAARIAQVAHRGEAGEQGLPGIGGRPQGTVRGVHREALDVGLGRGLGAEVDVGVDPPRHHRVALEVDHRLAGRRRPVAVLDRRDPAALDHHRDPLAGAVRLAVDQPAGMDQGAASGGIGGLSRPGGGGEGERERKKGGEGKAQAARGVHADLPPDSGGDPSTAQRGPRTTRIWCSPSSASGNSAGLPAGTGTGAPSSSASATPRVAISVGGFSTAIV